MPHPIPTPSKPSGPSGLNLVCAPSQRCRVSSPHRSVCQPVFFKKFTALQTVPSSKHQQDFRPANAASQPNQTSMPNSINQLKGRTILPLAASPPSLCGLYRGEPSYLSTATMKFFDVFLTAFHKRPDFHVFSLYNSALNATSAVGRAINRPHCPNSFRETSETGNEPRLVSDCGNPGPAGLSLTYVSSAGKTLMPVWEPSNRMEVALAPDWRLIRFSDKRSQARFVQSVFEEGPAIAV